MFYTSPVQNKLTLWMIDTRHISPEDDLFKDTGSILALLPKPSHAAILSKVNHVDFRMSLASAVLKYYYISQALDIPMLEVCVRRGSGSSDKSTVYGKPAAVDRHGNLIPGIDFNISHHGGIVTLIGWCDVGILTPSKTVQVGIDIALAKEVGDIERINDNLQGFVDFVGDFDDFFNKKEQKDLESIVDHILLPKEYNTQATKPVVIEHGLKKFVTTLKSGQTASYEVNLVGGARNTITFDTKYIIEAKLRRFYSYWACKEAYIKLVGEGLLAEWIRDLEFCEVKSPLPIESKQSTDTEWGQCIRDIQIYLHDARVNDVHIDLRAFEQDFIIACAIKGLDASILNDLRCEHIDMKHLISHISLRL